MSTVRTDLQPAASHAANHAPSQAPRATPDGSDLPLVLIVDDAPDNLLAFGAALRRHDVEVVTASSGRAALNVLLERDVAVAIVDVMMPDMDGFELAGRIRGVERTRHLPIIFVTASSKQYHAFTGYEVGAIDFLFKPIDPFVLRTKVDVLVMLDRQRRHLEAALEKERRARQDAQVAEQRRAALQLISDAALAHLEVEPLLEQMLARVRKIFGCDTATLLLSSADRQRLHVRACDGLERAAWDRLEVPCGVGVVGRIATSGEPAIVDDLASADVVTTVLQERLRSLAGVPLVLKGTVMGVLHIGCAQPRKFAREDIDLLEMVAARVALGLDRAATYTELQQTLRHNEIFTGVLAHDLRNPLGAIRTAAELLLLRQKDERKEITRPLHRIISSSQRITGLIDCVLDFTRTRVDGRVMLHAREADIGELCRQVVAELALAKPDWRVEVASRGDLHGTWDPDRLPQVLSNVIANAGRQGSAGSKILVDLDGADPRGVTLRVHDDGRIPEALLPNLFSPFRGVEERRGGLGLGLFIARAVVVSHGGTIDVTSSSAAGTTFTITLPRHVCLGDPA